MVNRTFLSRAGIAVDAPRWSVALVDEGSEEDRPMHVLSVNSFMSTQWVAGAVQGICIPRFDEKRSAVGPAPDGAPT